MINSNKKRDKYLDKELDNHQKRINRHCRDLEALCQENHPLEDRVLMREVEADHHKEMLMEILDQLCHCVKDKAPVLEGNGTADSLFELNDGLEYAGLPSSYHDAPLASSESAEAEQPQAIVLSAAPIPVPSPMRNSDQENVHLACYKLPTPTSSPLVLIKEEMSESERLAKEAEEQVAQDLVCAQYSTQFCCKTGPFKHHPFIGRSVVRATPP
jgi:hypothetical protein